MHTTTLATAACLVLANIVTAQRGFHLFDRQADWFHKTPADWCPKKNQCADIKEPFDYNSVWLVPANNYNCDVIRDQVSFLFFFLFFSFFFGVQN